MADINFGILDTQLPGRIAAIPQEAQKQQTANMLQAMQMQGAMNQNELAQSQIRTARRAEEGQTQLGKAYSGLDFSGASTGGVPGQSPFAAMKTQVIKSLTGSNRADLIPSELARINEMEHKETVNKELVGKINQQKIVAQNYEADRYKKALVNVSNYDSAAYWLRHQYDNPVLKDIISIVPFETALAEIPKDPVGLADWKNRNALGLEKYIEQNKPNITTRNTGTTTELLSTPGLGGAATVVPGSQATIQISPNTTATLKQAQDHFNSLSAFQKQQLADAGWTFDSDRGLAVNAKRGISQPISTLMTPVSGGAAPAGGGAPVPSIAPGGGVPGQRQAPAGQPAAGVLGPKPADLQKTEIELNKQYTSESKGFIETKIAIDKARAALRDAATNPTAGLSAGTAFMKILDPQSVVRETELAMALKSSGWFDRVTNISNTLRSGKTVLTPTQIINLSRTIDGLFEEVKAEQRIVDSGYARRAKSYGLDVGNIIIDRGQNKIGITEKTPLNAPPIESFRPSSGGRDE